MSIAQRIFIALFVLGLLPFYALLYYMYSSSSKQLQKTVEIEQRKKVEAINIMIDQDIDVLNREVVFLSKLPLMDDLITGDIDHRIKHLLEIKQRVYKLATTIIVSGQGVKIIAKDKQSPNAQEGIRFTQKIVASFNGAWQIGTIEIVLPFSSLEHYFKTRKERWCAMYENRAVAGDCRFDAANDVKFTAEEVAAKLNVSLIANRATLERPILLLRRQLLLIALFALVALSSFFLFVSRMISKPIAQNIQLQQQKLQLLESAKSAAESKNRFISQMSHDFRTPLNSIIGFSQFIQEEKFVKGEFAHVPGLIEHSGKELLALVNQLLEYAKLEHSELPLHFEPFNGCELIKQVAKAMQLQAEQKGIELHIECENITLYSDMNLVKSIVSNLLSNAIKYTNEGFVRISLQRNSGVEIKVQDSGIGIDAKEAKHLFEPFVRLKGSQSVQGSGLGLALCSAYALKIGALLGYREYEHGSEFYLQIKEQT